MRYLVYEEIVAINRVVVELSGGSVGIREPGLLESIIVKPQANLYGQEMYPDIFLKAAVIYEALVNYHVFIDGNKRTGLATMVRFLHVNGYKFTAKGKEMEDYTVLLATSKPDLAEIAQWIKKKAKKL